MRDVTEIISIFVGAAIVALLVGHSKDTTAIIGASSSGLSGLLKDITLTNNFANPVAN